MKFIKSLAAMAATAAVLAVPGVSQAGIVIDDFSVSQALLKDSTAGSFLPAPTSLYSTNIANDAGSGSSVSGSSANILGGERDILVYKDSDLTPSPGPYDRVVSTEVVGGLLTFSSQSRAGGFAVVRWDGANAYNKAINTGGLGGIDLSLGGVAIQLTSVADQSYDMTFQVWTDSGSGYVLSEFTKTVAAGAQTELFSFASFAGANFSKVGALQMIINTGAKTVALDVDIDIVGTVPEPGSVALAGLALLGLGLARRRQA